MLQIPSNRVILSVIGAVIDDQRVYADKLISGGLMHTENEIRK